MSAEEIIILKQYFELSPSELDQVSAYATNKAEFDDMKSFLLDTKNVFESEKITTSKALDKDIMAHLHASPANRQVWYNSVWLFLFPEGKQFYRAPAFQMALTAVIGFGIFGLINTEALNADTMAFEQSLNMEEVPTVKSEEVNKGMSDEGSGDMSEIKLTDETLKEDVLLEEKELNNHIIEESQIITYEVEESEEFFYSFDAVEEETVIMAPVSNVGSSFSSVPTEKDIPMEVENELVILTESNYKAADVFSVLDEVNLETKKKESRKDYRKNKSEVTTPVPSSVEDVTSLALGIEQGEEVISKIEKEKGDSSQRKAATVEHTQELLPLFFEVK